MHPVNQSFKAAEIGHKFETACSALDQILEQEGSKEAKSIQHKLRDELKQYQEQGVLTIAFVGQYSAGKSTIISALTGRRDIHIDADIATDKTAFYDWNQVRLIDTPGLFTDRPDHDAITYEAISKADLLVFCLTYMLFDSITVENFKKLAYEKSYRWKILLVVNKMSAEAGDEEQKLISYRHSLAEALKPQSLDEFPIAFIDAKDYSDGVDEEDDFLLEISRFQTFVEQINIFVGDRAALARFDTPVRIALAHLNEAQISFTRNTKKDTVFLELLNCLSRITQNERDRLRTKVKAITLAMKTAVIEEGDKLASSIGQPGIGQTEFERLYKQAEVNVRNCYEQAARQLQAAAEKAYESIKPEFEKIFQSELMQAFIARLEFTGQIPVSNTHQAANSEAFRTQAAWLKQIGSKAGINLQELATRKAFATAGSGSLRSMDVVGSQLHQTIYKAGKFVGYKFKPFEAVGMAKNIGNAAKILGPALALLAAGLQMYDLKQERDHERNMARVRQDIRSQFEVIAKDLEFQIDDNLWEFETKLYGAIEQNIAAACQQEENAIADSNQFVGELAEVRQQLKAIIAEISAGRSPA